MYRTAIFFLAFSTTLWYATQKLPVQDTNFLCFKDIDWGHSRQRLSYKDIPAIMQLIPRNKDTVTTLLSFIADIHRSILLISFKITSLFPGQPHVDQYNGCIYPVKCSSVYDSEEDSIVNSRN